MKSITIKEIQGIGGAAEKEKRFYMNGGENNVCAQILLNMMDIIQMEYLLVIVEQDYNLTKAAESLFLSQPALSKTIRNLETTIGSEIFTRKRGRLVGLTDVGKILYEKAVQIVELYDDLQHQLSDYKKSTTSYCLIGLLPDFMPFVYQCINEIAQSYNDAEGIFVDVREYYYWELMKNFNENLIDIAISVSSEEQEAPHDRSITIAESQYIAVYDRRFHTFPDGPIKWTDLNQQTLVYTSELSKSKFIIEAMLSRLRIRCKKVIQLMDPNAILQTILHTDYIAILPDFFYQMHAAQYYDTLQSAPFTTPIPWYMKILIKKASRDPLSEEVFQALAKRLPSCMQNPPPPAS